MSQFPSGGQPGAPNPFGTAPTYQPPKKSNVWLWILLGVGGVVVMSCVCCGGFMWFGFNLVGQQVIGKLNSDPIAQQHLGTVSSATMDFAGIADANKGNAPGGKQYIVFAVKGDKGSGKVKAIQKPGGQDFEDATLILPSGEEVKLGF